MTKAFKSYLAGERELSEFSLLFIYLCLATICIIAVLLSVSMVMA